MTRPFPPKTTDFFLTSPSPCPYLPHRHERKIFTLLGGETASAVNAALTEKGFRRSQNIAYLPACERCSACQPVRVRAKDTDLSDWKRILKRNADLSRKARPPRVTTEQFSVLRGYLDARHSEGGMADMTVLDYQAMVEQTPVDTLLFEYRDEAGALLACALTDRTHDGLSMVYSFFEPDAAQRSLGTYMIVDHLALAQSWDLSYVYLGYWIAGSRKMAYKQRFEPLEILTARGWQDFAENARQPSTR